MAAGCVNTTVWVSAGGGGAGAGGAIACVELAGDIDEALAALGINSVHPGRTGLRRVPVGQSLRDDAVIGRWTTDRATVMTHGGRAVIDGFIAACERVGIHWRAHESVYIEAADDVERAMLAALSRAASPAAVDLLLDQPRRWRAMPGGERSAGERDRILRRLIEPALVVAVGPPNIGKSSLLNALAGRSVSVVADAPGTTRDHVGALIDLGGVVVRWVDTPGLGGKAKSEKREPEMGEPETDAAIQAEAQRLAREVAARADVLVLCRDAEASIEPPPTAGVVVRIGLRDDLGASPGVDASASVRLGRGIESVVRAVREAAVPERLVRDGEPWLFWG